MGDINLIDPNREIIIDKQNEYQQSSHPYQNNFYIVGIGASAGGLEALEKFFLNVTCDSGMAYVIIQHLSPDYKSFMTELISKYTKMDVFQAQNEMYIKPNCVYLNPPKFNITVSNGQFFLKEQQENQKINLAIDTFLNSLAKDTREKAIGIILSGTGSDGTRGCRAIKEAGGIVLSQDEQSAKFNGMPRSVISTMICDYIIPPSEMPGVLLSYIGQPSLKLSKLDTVIEENESAGTLSSIYSILKKQHSIDFSLYKQTTVLRCIDRRMKIIHVQDLEEYLSIIKESIEEVDFLYNSLLIGVTRFFRDEGAFNEIKKKVIPEIFEGKTENSTIRVWVAGCSTGEEAYSLAILFKEYMDYSRKNLNVKIFATDIDNKSLEYASKGVYPDSISEDIPSERLNRYFIRKKDAFHVAKVIRDMVIFSYHNVISNPPFYKINLLSCRNMLIYFQSPLQKRILSTFHFALETGAFLFLGSSETPGELSSYFSSVDKINRIYKCRETKKRPLVDDLSVISTGLKVFYEKSDINCFTNTTRSNSEIENIHEALVEKCMLPSAVVDLDGEFVEACGDCDKFLKVPRGGAHYDILKMVPQELSTALGTALNKVKKENTAVTYTNIKLMLKEEQITINLIVKPFTTRKKRTFAYLTFKEVNNEIAQEEHVESYDTVSKLMERISDLEQELQYTKESLQTSIEELETSSEELQAANEELLVSNEELQSTNEELQSVNEELLIVNSQYQYKIQELADLNNDMINFLNSTNIGTIFLDTNLCVRKFTPAVTKEINLIEQDIGRPISHISHNLINEDIINESREVISNLTSIEKEVESTNGKWYILKYSPFRTHENTIKGVVISLIDITARKKAEESLQRSKERYEKLVELAPFAIFIIHDEKITFTNTEGLNLLQVKSLGQLVGNPMKDYLSICEQQLIDKRMEYVQEDARTVVPLEEKIVRPDGSTASVEITSVPIMFDEEHSQLIILRDITYRKLAEELKQENESKELELAEATALDSLKNDFFSNLSHELRTPLNVILSSLQLLEATAINENICEYDKKLIKYHNIMKQNCYRQLRLVNNMIDVTKIDAGFFDISLRNYNIVEIIEDITFSVSEYIKIKSIGIIFDTNTEEKIIACDPDKLERVMLNLLSNAVKFNSENGKIYINIYDKGESVIISVKDTGIGIPENKLNIVFDRFRQVEKSLTRSHEGSGIGLSLVKSLVEIHGGTISLKSKYGEGTEFIIELPANVVDEDENAIITDDEQQKSKVEKINIEFSDIYSLD